MRPLSLLCGRAVGLASGSGGIEASVQLTAGCARRAGARRLLRSSNAPQVARQSPFATSSTSGRQPDRLSSDAGQPGRATGGGDGAAPQDGSSPSQEEGARLGAARWTVVIASLGLVSFAFFPRERSEDNRGLLGQGARSSKGAPCLHPHRYGKFKVLSVDRVTTPFLRGRPDETGDGQHVLIRIHARVEPSAGAEAGSSSSSPHALQIASVYLKEPALQIERAYTPLRRPGNRAALPRQEADDDEHEDVVELLIKRYADGELSRYASTLRAGDVVELRGPVLTWDWVRDHARAARSAEGGQGLPSDIVLLVGGTGITTAHQLLHSTLTAGTDAQSPRIQVLYATPKPASCLLLPELADIQQKLRSLRNDPDAARVRLVAETLGGRHGSASNAIDGVDCAGRTTALSQAGEPGGVSTQSGSHGCSQGWLSWLPRRPTPTILGLAVSQGRITSEQITQMLQDCRPAVVAAAAAAGSTQTQAPAQADRGPVVLVCGPDGMVAALAGPKDQDGSGGQGELGGLLARLKLRREDVFKL